MSTVPSRIGNPVRTLPPNAFAFVMATGIVGTAFTTAGLRAVGVVMAAVGTVGFLILAVLLIVRAITAPDRVAADLRAPARGFGFFTVVAALGVLAALFAILGIPWVATVAAIVAIPLWLLITYGMMPLLVLSSDANEPVTRAVDGSWMLWVVATQALAIIVTTLGAGIVGIALWGAGVVLYLLIAGLLTARLFGRRGIEAAVEPTAWVVMGAAAISALAAARLGLLPELLAVRPFITGMALLLWGFGTWCVPFLVIAGVWKRFVKREPLRYEAPLWAVVFPLGMYTVATQALARATASHLLNTIGQVALWVSGLAWIVVAVLGVVALARPTAR
ncbi:tellurite resistance/C4-dicarboxylate transporter family protein [Leifsonia sp. NPDC077715]|uniref:tellurite resistance/C4-dicarboxylate transporter family protein n=1 Tax=Leifsonia sp. NPDC077715 TaxID=3155539 RepID=UPI0034139BC7